MQKVRLALLFWGCALVGMSIGSALALLVVYTVADIREIKHIPEFIHQVSQLANGWYVLIFVQAITHLFSYLIPALIYWHYVEQSKWNDFQKHSLKTVALLGVGIISIITIMPFNDLLIDWNQQLRLPHPLDGVAQWMRQKEQEGTLLTNQLTAFSSWGQLLIAVVVVGFIASLGEEVFFRGVIQRKLIDWTTNVHAGIWLAATLFSAAHFQFYGFFPRLLLGALFGYLYYWSGNLWVSILAHLLNNSWVVIILYAQRQLSHLENPLQLITDTLFWEFTSLIGSAVLLFYFYKANLRMVSKIH